MDNDDATIYRTLDRGAPGTWSRMSTPAPRPKRPGGALSSVEATTDHRHTYDEDHAWLGEDLVFRSVDHDLRAGSLAGHGERRQDQRGETERCTNVLHPDTAS